MSPVRAAALALGLLSLAAGTVAGQDEAVASACLTCGPDRTESILLPGTDAARRAIFEPLGSPPAPPQEPSLPSCGTVALITGAISAAAMVLLAVVLESAFIWYEDESATSYYLAAGGIAFGLGAGYGLARCLIKRS